MLLFSDLLSAIATCGHMILRKSVVASALVLLVACSPPPRVDVLERSVLTVQAETEKIGGSLIRIIQPGDTMHAIAFGMGLNVNELANWNGLADTSKLKVGQQLRLTKPLNYVPPRVVVASQSSKRHTPAQAVNQNTSAQAVNQSTSAQAVNQRTSAQAVNVKTPAAQKNAHPVVRTTKPQAPTSRATFAARPQWVWPTQGKVIRQFALAQGRQGIDIQGRVGQSVIAASAGEVVYVGNGLKGYGNLIIIKHNEHYLSAYAHNQRILVKEGQPIAAKQSIASMGNNRRGQTALHFQIRKDGKPLNPMSFLPAG